MSLKPHAFSFLLVALAVLAIVSNATYIRQGSSYALTTVTSTSTESLLPMTTVPLIFQANVGSCERHIEETTKGPVLHTGTVQNATSGQDEVVIQVQNSARCRIILPDPSTVFGYMQGYDSYPLLYTLRFDIYCGWCTMFQVTATLFRGNFTVTTDNYNYGAQEFFMSFLFSSHASQIPILSITSYVVCDSNASSNCSRPPGTSIDLYGSVHITGTAAVYPHYPPSQSVVTGVQLESFTSTSTAYVFPIVQPFEPWVVLAELLLAIAIAAVAIYALADHSIEKRRKAREAFLAADANARALLKGKDRSSENI